VAQLWESWNQLVARRRRLLVAAVTVLVASTGALALGQLVLPGLAASRLRTSLRADGKIEGVSVSAAPALELLWGHADSVRIRFSTMHVSIGRTGALLARTRAAQDVDASVGTLVDGPIVLEDARLRKRGASLLVSATLTRSALAGALPPGVSVTPVAGGGTGLRLRAVASLFGLSVGTDLAVTARQGRVILDPVGLASLGGLAQLTVFADPRVHVDAVGIRAGRGGAYVLEGRAHLTR
jgi:hypothetical protein